MVRKGPAMLLVGLLIMLSPSYASGGTLGMAPGTWARPLSDARLQSIRAGSFGVAFSLFFEGMVEDGRNLAGVITTDRGTLMEPPLDFSVTNGETSVRTALGDFHGARGVFQVNQVPGNFNVVHNNLFIQVTLVTVPSGAAIPALMSSLNFPFR